MRHPFHLFGQVLILLLCTCGSALAQHNISKGLLNKLDVVTLPAQDNDRLLSEELARRKPGRANTFAVAIPTRFRPATSGEWIEQGNTSTWFLRLRSPGAKTINLGFSEYQLPEGAELFLTTDSELIGPFTAADNADHNELWTPLLGGDDMLVELRVPTTKKKEVQLYLTFVNHDFEDVRQSLSGSCNLDVICGAADGWGIVDQYRDVIRSVAAYTLNGRDNCTGFLINNTNEDGAPFFMTANHCNVFTNNDQSVVTYWNFESPTCRQPFSPESGDIFVGDRNVFNTGAIYLASSGNSDMCLTRLEEPVNPAANPFYAGWSLDALAPNDTVIAVHHPGVDEKRISFSYQNVTRTVASGASNANGRFLVVESWDIGTTEGGSSGSPLFDRFKRVRGQLFRGSASCENSEGSDQYGYFTSSWEGDGTVTSAVKSWLDPCGIGLTQMDGFDGADVENTLKAKEYCFDNCTNNTSNFDLTLGSNFPDGTNLTIIQSSAGINPVLSDNTADGGQTVTLSVPGGDDVAEGTYRVTVRAQRGDLVDDVVLTLDLFEFNVASPDQLNPVDEAQNVSPLTTFSWAEVADAAGYDFQLSSRVDFATLVINETNLSSAVYGSETPLMAATTYYYRVRSTSPCGPSFWQNSTFLVANQLCDNGESTDTPVDITAATPVTVMASLEIDAAFDVSEMSVLVDIEHEFVGDLSATLTSPEGITVNLFNSPRNGSCSGTNILATFSDEATLTSADFANTCNLTNEVSIEGLFKPAQSFSAFSQTGSEGTWVLRVRDASRIDGGILRRFEIDICSPAGDVRDYSANSVQPFWEACLENPASFDLSLGSSYDESVEVSIRIGQMAFEDFTTQLDLGNNLITLNISDWGDLDPRDYDVTIEVTNDGGVFRQIVVPLALLTEAIPSTLIIPEDRERIPVANTVDFSWVRSLGAESYTLQTSVSEDFTDILAFTEVTITEASLDNLPAGGDIFWRVVSNNESCGSAVSAVRSFTFEGTSTRFFGEDRSISIYPNPAHNDLVINLRGSWTNDLKGQLYDATGRQLRAFTIAGAGVTQWDVSALAQGVYFLRVQSGVRQYTERVVVR